MQLVSFRIIIFPPRNEWIHTLLAWLHDCHYFVALYTFPSCSSNRTSRFSINLGRFSRDDCRISVVPYVGDQSREIRKLLDKEQEWSYFMTYQGQWGHQYSFMSFAAINDYTCYMNLKLYNWWFKQACCAGCWRRPSPNEAPPIGKIHPFCKMAVTFEPLMGFWCPSGFRKFLITMT